MEKRGLKFLSLKQDQINRNGVHSTHEKADDGADLLETIRPACSIENVHDYKPLLDLHLEIDLE